MNNRRILLALFLIYFVFAILLNSVGTVILQVIHNYGVDKGAASVLEGFKDLPIAIVSFLVASSLPRFGYKKAMLVALAIVGCATLAMPLLPGFATAKLLFLCVGVAFALVKVSVYSTIGLVARDRQPARRHHEHAGRLLHGRRAVGLLDLRLLHRFRPTRHRRSWLNVYWLLAGLCAATFLLVLATPFDERAAAPPDSRGPAADFVAMLRLFVRPLVCVFVLTAFLYVLVEQSRRHLAADLQQRNPASCRRR